MEKINEKAFDDELNKAEESIEGVKRDKTPLPVHYKKNKSVKKERGCKDEKC